MKLIKEYTKYLKDNPKGYWFKAKWYGWGWVPATWQAWAVLAIYLFLIFEVTITVDSYSHSVNDTFYRISIPILALTTLLLFVCYIKGERPHWSWGKPKKKK